MRYPVSNFKTEWNSTAGLGFGAKTSYGFHDGQDLNDNGGGNSDLGKDIFAISSGEEVYWHGAKHPTTGFGYHSVYKISGAWGTRWVHQAHCQPDLTQAPKAITENERIAHVGNSGTEFAHIHFAVFKVDPATLRDGIDTIAKTQQELNDWWEDPIKFIEKWMQPVTLPVNLQAELDKVRKERDENHNKYLASQNTISNLNTQISKMQSESSIKDTQISSLQSQVLTITQEVENLRAQASELIELKKVYNQLELDAQAYRLNAEQVETRNLQRISQLEKTSYLTANTSVLVQQVTKNIFHVL